MKKKKKFYLLFEHEPRPRVDQFCDLTLCRRTRVKENKKKKYITDILNKVITAVTAPTSSGPLHNSSAGRCLQGALCTDH